MVVGDNSKDMQPHDLYCLVVNQGSAEAQLTGACICGLSARWSTVVQSLQTGSNVAIDCIHGYILQLMLEHELPLLPLADY